MGERDELVRVVAEALLGHQNISLGTPDTMRCGGCGLRTNGGANSPDHVHHQAAAVVDALGERRLLAERAEATRVPQGVFEAAVAEMSTVERMHPRATLDALLYAALPALGLTHESEG